MINRSLRDRAAENIKKGKFTGHKLPLLVLSASFGVLRAPLTH